CGLAAAADPSAIRIVRLPDSGMGSRADRLGHAAAKRRGGRKGDCGGRKLNLKPIHRGDAEGAEGFRIIFLRVAGALCDSMSWRQRNPTHRKKRDEWGTQFLLWVGFWSGRSDLSQSLPCFRGFIRAWIALDDVLQFLCALVFFSEFEECVSLL